MPYVFYKYKIDVAIFLKVLIKKKKKCSYDSHPKNLQKKAQNCWNLFVNYKTTYSRTLKMVPPKSRNEIKEKYRNFNQKLAPQPTQSRSNNNHTSNEPIREHSTRRWWWNDSRWVKRSIYRLLLSFVIWSPLLLLLLSKSATSHPSSSSQET